MPTWRSGGVKGGDKQMIAGTYREKRNEHKAENQKNTQETRISEGGYEAVERVNRT